MPSPASMGPVLPPLALYSVVIPARDEEQSLPGTVQAIHATLSQAGIAHEIVVVDDGSQDRTWEVLGALQQTVGPTLRPVQNPGPHGFGRAVVYGLNESRGDAIVIMMADASDSPEEAVRYWHLLQTHECVFGSRFIRGGRVVDYPRLKLLVNRFANFFIRVLFRHGLNDTTNAFKAYRRNVIDGCRPFLAPHFNLTVELPLKAIVRGYTWTIVPISWQNRRHGVAKLKIKEMGSRYFFICAYVWLERYFSRGDYHRTKDSR